MHADLPNSPNRIVANGDVGRGEVLREDGHESTHLGLDMCEADLSKIAKEGESALAHVRLLVLGALV